MSFNDGAYNNEERAESYDDSQILSFNVQDFLAGLDAIFDQHDAATRAEPYLLEAMTQAENAQDLSGLLTILNETMGFYRSQSRHQDNQWIIQRAIELALRMGLEGTEAWATTLINAATSQRAAGNYEQAADLYEQALAAAERSFKTNDRRLAALHNNYSMLYSETNRPQEAQQELRKALAILESSSTDPTQDVDIASTCTNLALLLTQKNSDTESTPTDDSSNSSDSRDSSAIASLDEAQQLASRAVQIYHDAHAENSAHFASALAGHAQVCFAIGDFATAVHDYERALAIIAECYGEQTDYYCVTAHNLEEARKALKEYGGSPTSSASSHTNTTVATPTSSQSAAPQSLSGLQLARDYWLAYGKPMIAEHYPEYMHRIAVGLVGHGSECYGFDDDLSRDHDFGPRFCMWLTPEDYAHIGDRLQADYESLPQEFQGYTRTASTPRAQGEHRRDGVFSIDSFFTSITGFAQAPQPDEPHLWMSFDEATLAAATNGRVFADALGAFSKTRQSFKLMPDDVRLALISQRLGMISQAGQYNLPRMLQRNDGASAMLCITQFIDAVSSLVFLINNPITVGYAPYYKWRFAGLRALSRRSGMYLSEICAQLEQILRLASSACYGGAGFGEGGDGAAPNIRTIMTLIDSICTSIVTTLRALGLTTSNENFLEWQRPYIESHIVSDATCLHSL